MAGWAVEARYGDPCRDCPLLHSPSGFVFYYLVKTISRSCNVAVEAVDAQEQNSAAHDGRQLKVQEGAAPPADAYQRMKHGRDQSDKRARSAASRAAATVSLHRQSKHDHQVCPHTNSSTQSLGKGPPVSRTYIKPARRAPAGL